MNLRSARRMEGGRVRQSHGLGRYCDIPPSAPDIVAIGVLQTLFYHHAIRKRHRRRFPPSAASVEEQGVDH